MSTSKNLMVTLTEAELKQLDKISNWLGCSKSRVISQALNMMAIELKVPEIHSVLGNFENKKGGK